LVGAGVSSTDIAKESDPFVKQTYQTHRSGDFDLPATTLPENAIRIDQVSSFQIDEFHTSTLTEDESLPVRIKLNTGQQLCDIDFVILCTGYYFSLPFLSSFHSDEVGFENAGEGLLVTKEGRQIHNLHKGMTRPVMLPHFYFY
jgi:ACS family pantothenate transporter-like MFS transporter